MHQRHAARPVRPQRGAERTVGHMEGLDAVVVEVGHMEGLDAVVVEVGHHDTVAVERPGGGVRPAELSSGAPRSEVEVVCAVGVECRDAAVGETVTAMWLSLGDQAAECGLPNCLAADPGPPPDL